MSLLSTGLTSLDIVLGVLAVLFAFGSLTRATRLPKGLRVPPGPRGKLIVGNAGDLPTGHELVTLDRWAKQYGDLVHIKVFGQPMIFVNSMDVAQDLFENRSRIYSDRPDFPMLSLMGWDYSFAFMRYGDLWRRQRRVFHQGFHPTAAAEYNHIQTKQARALLRSFYESPDGFVRHIRHFAGALIMEIVYGIQVLPRNDSYIDTAEKAMSALALAGIPGSFLVDIIPILKYVPAWMPGADFRRKARAWRISTVEMTVAPFAAVKDALSAGTAEPSFTASLLEELSHRHDAPADEEDVIRNAGASAYSAGSDTTVSSLTPFMLAMILNPEAQRKAQDELDSVLDPDHLPEFEDRRNLPYVNALCKEVLRWHPVAPLGIAHRNTQDDVYKDYFIPRGSLVIGNSWTILHDERLYGPRTGMFEPERFLKPGVKNPTAQFGFGRRMCAGRHLADNSIFIVVASILKSFTISHAMDSNGNEIPVKASWTSGFLSHPVPFQCSIKPRTASIQSIIFKEADV